MSSIKSLITKAIRSIQISRRMRALILTLSVITVFVVSYLLILPAITLDEKEAERQGGIDIATEAPATDNQDASEEGSEKTSSTEKEKKTEEAQKTPVYKAGELSYDGKTFDIEAAYKKDAKIPEGTELKVEEIVKKDDQYQKYYDKALKAVQDNSDQKKMSLASARFYDISLIADNKEIEPSDTVNVKISYEDGLPAQSAEQVRVIHFTEDGKSGKVKATILKDKDVDAKVVKKKLNEAAFDAESFSVYAIVTLEEPGQLSEKTYGIINTQNGSNPKGTAMMSVAQNNNTKLQGKSTTVRVDPVGREDNVYVANNSEITMWSFADAGDGKYYITTTVGGSLKYLKVSSGGVSLVEQSDIDNDCKITITSGSGNYTGKYKFSTDNAVLTLNGNNFEKANKTANGAGVWMNLAERSNLNDDDFVVYTANKVSISEADAQVKNGDEVVIYTRIWNDDTKRYDYYAIDHDGKLVQAYESGDTISWVGSKVNTMLWDFTEYYYEGTTTPNYYYELQNTYSDKYIAPQVSGDGFLSDNTIGINLYGRRYNEYYSTILAWDDPYYDYASLKVRDYQLISAPMSKADDFYFAKMTKGDQPQTEALTPVSTVNNDDYGIELKMQDYPYQGYYVDGGYRSKTQTDILGRNSEKSGSAAYSGLLTRNLDGDYPKTTDVAANAGGQNGTSLGNLYNDTITVNHQFLTSTYKETGYFEYDCTQNFAHLISSEDDPWIGKDRPDGGQYELGDFVVYDQLGTSDLSAKETLQHGQFLPYNDLSETYNVDGTSSKNPTNETDLYGKPLSSLDPRKGEKLYGISARFPGTTGSNTGAVDYFFGMELSAKFMQSESGLDAWGHDLIFEFSGDDDFWLYVDGMLVLDLGGVHSAVDGSVNFRTGEVQYINDKGEKVTTTLRDLYQLAYVEAHPDASGDEIEDFLNGYFKEGGTVFKDFSGHTMRMFYMERGSNASNLHMRFNLAPYTDGEVLLEKEVTGTENVDMSFPFQIMHKVNGVQGQEFIPLDDPSKVTDYQTGNASDVTYQESYSPAEGLTYSNVFFLKLGQTVSIKLPSEDTEYYIQECALDTATFDTVTANGEAVPGIDTDPSVSNRKDYKIVDSTVSGRKKVIYDNHVSPDALKSLTITKRLWQDNEKTHEIFSGTGDNADNTEFRFRIYIGKDGDDYTIYNTRKYYVKDPEGHYCIYQNGGFVSTGKTNFDDLDTTVPEGEWKSEQEKATFYSSPGGAIDKIKAGYSIEIPGLMAGTAYLVEERDYEIPAGYNLLGYTLTDGKYSADNTGTATQSGVIDASKNQETVSVHNQHGYGLTVNKNWSDAPFMDWHDSIYFAVYLKGSNDPLPGSVRQMKDPNTSIRWFFQELIDGKTLNDYEVYEVELTGDIVVDPDTGVVSGYRTITRKEQDEPIDVDGTANDQGYSETHTYTVSYDRQYLNDEEIANHVNSRTDTVTNARPGIKLIKTDMNGDPLANAVFELTDGEKSKRFTSDPFGLIVVAYLQANKEYTLREVAAPSGYLALIDTLTIEVDAAGQVFVNGKSTDSEDGYYTIEQVEVPTADNMPTVTIRNKDFSLKAIKVDSYADSPMAGVKFALYKEVTEYGTGNPMPDYAPMEGYEELVTDENGIIPKIVLKNSQNPNGLKPGTYYLRETEVSSAYKSLDMDIRITISATGTITLQSATRPVQSGSWIIGELSSDIAEKTESESGALTITVKNTPNDPIRIRKLEESTTDKYLANIKFELYKSSQVRNGQPIDGETPILSGSTDQDGIMNLSGLEESIYYLFETETLDGYILPDAPVMISIFNGQISASINNTPLTCRKVKDADNRDVWEITVYNSAGVELPYTGGSGTRLIYLFGVLLILLSATGLAVKKRREAL